MVDPRSSTLPSDAETEATEEAPSSEPALVDETGPGSFPASDPPAVWTWEIESGPPEAVAPDASERTS